MNCISELVTVLVYSVCLFYHNYDSVVLGVQTIVAEL